MSEQQAEPTVRTYSVVNRNGTAMPESTLCADCHSEERLRLNSESIARAADDCDDPTNWKNTTDNDEAPCSNCGAGEWVECKNHGWVQRVLDDETGTDEAGPFERDADALSCQCPTSGILPWD